MKSSSITITVAALAAVALTLLDAPSQGKKKHKIKPTVTFATSWDRAVEEAQLLSLPIVVHSHGFR